MLIEFKTANFRSIREEQTLSLVASNYDNSLPESLIHPTLAGLSKVKLLKGGALYGPNASGKSNILLALNFMAIFVKDSATRLAPTDPTGTVPFCLDTDSPTKPSSFEVTAMIEGARYDYGFTLDKKQVHHEFLVAYPKGSAQNWFERTYDPQKQDYSWDHSTFFKLDKELCDKTRPNSLFLSTGAQFNNAQLTILYNWFSVGLHFINLGADWQFGPYFTATFIENRKPAILELLKSADFGITDATVQDKELSVPEVRDRLSPAIVRQMETSGKLTPQKVFDIWFKHRGDTNGDSAINFADESAGTRRFFSLLGPWLDILDHGYTVLIDELETSLHPLLVKEFLKLLFSADHNPKGAQVIFTTHNPIFLDTDIIRRDQVWFTEKDEHGATHLYPLTDYKPRRTESLGRGYLAGRYNAIPFIPEGLKMR